MPLSSKEQRRENLGSEERKEIKEEEEVEEEDEENMNACIKVTKSRQVTRKTLSDVRVREHKTHKQTHVQCRFQIGYRISLSSLLRVPICRLEFSVQVQASK